MTCQHAQDLWMRSLDETLDTSERTELDQHLASCPPCVRSLRQTIVTTQVLRGLGAVEQSDVAPAMPESLVTKILASRKAAGLDVRKKLG